MDKTLRLQCRVTPATKELLDHLNTIHPDYRAKRLIMMAAMYLSMAGSSDHTLTKKLSIESTTVVDLPSDQSSRPVANWIRSANV